MAAERNGLIELRRPIAFLYPPQPLDPCLMPRHFFESHPMLEIQFMDILEVLNWRNVPRPAATQWPVRPRSPQTMRAAHVGVVAFSLALTQLLEEKGVTPDVVFGHSLGVHSALCASGATVLTDTLEVVDRTAAFVAQPQNGVRGGMLAVTGLTAEEVAGFCRDMDPPDASFVSIINSHRQVIVSGETRALGRLARYVRRQTWKLTRLPVSLPLHSPLMMPLTEACATLVADMKSHIPHAQLLHPTSAEPLHTISMVDGLWRTHLLAIVDFVRALDKMEALGVQTYIEVGVGEALTRLGRWHRRDLPIMSVGNPEVLERVLANARME